MYKCQMSFDGTEHNLIQCQETSEYKDPWNPPESIVFIHDWKLWFTSQFCYRTREEALKNAEEERKGIVSNLCDTVLGLQIDFNF